MEDGIGIDPELAVESCTAHLCFGHFEMRYCETVINMFELYE